MKSDAQFAHKAELAREIEARRTGVSVVSDDERQAINRALADLDAGKRVLESDMGCILEACRRRMRVFFSAGATNDLTSIVLYRDARSKAGGGFSSR